MEDQVAMAGGCFESKRRSKGESVTMVARQKGTSIRSALQAMVGASASALNFLAIRAFF